MNETNGGRTDSVGTLRISKEVLAAIAATAASEVAGVHSLTAPPVHFKGVLSRRKFPKSVSVNLQDDTAEIELRLVIGTDVKIPVVAEKVQRAVKESIQSMTNITVSRVHVVIDGIVFSTEAPAV